MYAAHLVGKVSFVETSPFDTLDKGKHKESQFVDSIVKLRHNCGFVAAIM